MKYFISQPMKGRSDADILAEREKTIASIKSKDENAEIIDSFFDDYTPCDGNPAMKYLARSIDKLAEADVVYFCEGWQNARGCKLEHDIAVAYGLEVHTIASIQY